MGIAANGPRWIFLAVLAIILGCAGIIIGGVLPWKLKTSVFPDAIKKSVVYTGSRLFEPPKISSVYDSTATGGYSADDDNGVNYTYYIANITNPDAVLAGGRIVLGQVGPLRYRRYVLAIEQQSSDYGVETWRERQIRRYLSSSAPAQFEAYPSSLQSAYVTQPNVGFAALVAQLAALIHSSTPIPFEYVAVPLFASGGASELSSAAAEFAPVTLTPLFLGYLFQTTITLYISSGSVAPAAAAATVLSDWTNATNPAPAGVVNVLMRGPAGLLNMQLAVAAALWSPTGPLSLLTAAGWSAWASALLGGESAVAALVGTFVTTFGPVDSNYYSNPYLGLTHVGSVLQFIGAFLTPGSPQYTTSTTTLAGVLQSAGLLPSGNWDDIAAATLAGNAPLGFLEAFVVGGGTLPVSPSVLEPIAGYNLLNMCPTGASLADSALAAAAGLSTPPEMSCWAARGLGGSSSAKFGARLSVAQMSQLLYNLTNGAGLAGQPLPGTANAASFVLAATQIATDAPAVIAANNVSSPLFVLALAGTYYAQYVAAVAASDSVAAGVAAASHAAAMAAYPSCPGYDVLGLGVNCAQLVDTASYLSYVAQKVVFEPTFVNVGPRVWNATSKTFVPHPDPFLATLFNEPNARRAGPLLRCTVTEAIEIGCHDNLLDYLSQLLFSSVPGAPASRIPPVDAGDFPYTAAGNASYAAYVATLTGTGYDSRYTGESDVNLADVAISVGGATQLTLWGGVPGSGSPITPIVGSFTGLQFPPKADLNVDYNAAPAFERIFVYKILRPVDIQYSGNTMDPSGQVRMWHFTLATTPDQVPSALPWYASDVAANHTLLGGSPRCGAYVAAISNGAPVIVGKPYFLNCGSDYSLAADYDLADGTSAPTEETHGTFLDVEPISGMVLNAHKRLGAHIRLGPSPWYPMRVATPLMFFVDESGTLSSTQARDIATGLSRARAAANVIVYTVALVLGGLFLILGVAMLIAYSRSSRAAQPSGTEAAAPQ